MTNETIAVGNAWTRFWFTPIPTTGMRCLRVLCGVVFLFWLLSFLGHQAEFFSLAGWTDKQALVDIQMDGNPVPVPMGWSFLYWADDNPTTFQAMYWGSVVVLALFTLGVATRITSILTWIIVVSFLANPITNYEGDYLLGILAFYQMFGHLFVGQWSGDLSIAERILGSKRDFVLAPWIWPTDDEAPPSYGANLMLRIFQIHFAMIVVTSGLHKLQMPEWWSGVALWYPLNPTFKTSLESLQRAAPNADRTLFFLSLAQYLVLAWQLTLPFYAWRAGRLSRCVLIGGGVIGWLGAMFLYQLPSFGPFVMIGCLSFLRPEEWTAILHRARPSELKAMVSGTRSDDAEAEPKKHSVASRKETNIKK